MIPALLAAAGLARKATDRDQFVEIVVEVEGLVVRGEHARPDGRKRAMFDVRWRTFDESPHRLSEGVRYVNGALAGLPLDPPEGFKRLSVPRFPAELRIAPPPMRGRIRIAS